MSDDSGDTRPTVDTEGLALDPPARRYVANEDSSDGRRRGRDVLLDRAVLLERAGGVQAADLERQAKFLGKLDHAGIGPVLDLVNEDGAATLVLRDVGGRSLADEMQRTARGEPGPALADPASVVLTLLKVCDILAAAHARRIVHGSLTADAIRLGDHGQVVIVDWRSAMTNQTAPATKRFVASSHAMDEHVALDGLHGDIRALGSILYTALTCEAPPITAAGTLGPIDPDVRHRLPTSLEAVVRQAMSSDAAHGYASVEAVSTDLRRVLAGLAPTAKRAGLFERAGYQLRRHAGAIAIALLLCTALLAVAWTALAPQWRTWRAWGKPVHEEHFQDASWTHRWTQRNPETWAVVDGRALATGLNESALIFRQRLTPPIAVEYTAQVLPDARIGDLSLWWCEEPGLLDDLRARAYNRRGWLFQIGAYENAFTSITRMPHTKPVAMSSFRIEPGRNYHVRVEIEDREYRVWVDGREVMRHTALLPASSGYVALFGYFPGKAFDDVRIWQRPVPPLISPLAVGDGAYHDGNFEHAAAHYARVAEAARDRSMLEQALFRQGLAERQAGDPYRSTATWKRISDPHLLALADCLLLGDLARSPEPDQALDRFRWFWQHRPAVRPTLALQWIDLVHVSAPDADMPQPNQQRWLDLRDQLFPDEPISAFTAASMLVRAQRYEDVIQRFPNVHREVASALLSLGRPLELLAQPWANSNERGMALYQLGRLDDIAGDVSLYPEMRALSLAKLGRTEELLADPVLHPWGLVHSGRAAEVLHPWGLVHSGRAAELLQHEALPTGLQNAVLMLTGRIAEAAGDGVPSMPRSGNSSIALTLHPGLDGLRDHRIPLYATLARLAGGDLEGAIEARARHSHHSSLAVRYTRLTERMLLPLIDVNLGRPDALREALRGLANDPHDLWGGVLRQVAAAALDPSAMTGLDSTVWRSELDAWRAVAGALGGEVRGDAAEALAGWQAFAALPMHQRLLMDNEPHGPLELTAAWRIRALTAR